MLALTRASVIIAAALLSASLMGGEQNTEDCASAKIDGNEVTIRSTSYDPVKAIGRTLADRFGISVNVESPQFDFPADAADVAEVDPEYSSTHNNAHYKLMKWHTLEVHFTGSGNEHHPDDIPTLLRQVADAANKELPYQYRLDINGDDYALVPTRARTSSGKFENVTPLLDRRVTIPAGTRTIAEHARIMAEDLSRQTGLSVSCCQMFVAGVPWGMAEISFEATNQPARDVLKSLMVIEEKNNSLSMHHPLYDHWILSCDGTGAPYCFIEVEGKYSPRCQLLLRATD